MSLQVVTLQPSVKHPGFSKIPSLCEVLCFSFEEWFNSLCSLETMVVLVALVPALSLPPFISEWMREREAVCLSVIWKYCNNEWS